MKTFILSLILLISVGAKSQMPSVGANEKYSVNAREYTAYNFIGYVMAFENFTAEPLTIRVSLPSGIQIVTLQPYEFNVFWLWDIWQHNFLIRTQCKKEKPIFVGINFYS